jgi:Glycosyltransferase family 87
VLALEAIPRPRRREWYAFATIAVLILGFLPIVVNKSVWLGQGDVQVFFRAGWAIWTGYPLYQVADHHGWTYHYPPTFALFMGFFANPLPSYPQPWWALPFPAAVAVWYLINVACLFAALHIWAKAVERALSIEAKAGYLQRPWALVIGPLLALLPFIGDGLARGQPAPVLLLLIVLFLSLYVEKRVAAAAFALSLAVTIKIFPIVLAVIPLMRRDWKFIFWSAGWSGVLLIALPVVCVGWAETVELYRAMLSDHLLGIVSGAMSHDIASQVSPGAFSNIGIGALVARIAAGDAFYSTPLPQWASAVQFAFNAVAVAAIVFVGRGGFWNVRAPQPADGYPVLVAGAILSATLPLMIPSAGPQYVTVAVPLMTVLLAETWRRKGAEIVTAIMILWSIAAWLSMIAQEVPWTWLKLVGPMSWVLLALASPSFMVLRDASRGSRTGPATTGGGIPLKAWLLRFHNRPA